MQPTTLAPYPMTFIYYTAQIDKKSTKTSKHKGKGDKKMPEDIKPES